MLGLSLGEGDELVSEGDSLEDGELPGDELGELLGLEPAEDGELLAGDVPDVPGEEKGELAPLEPDDPLEPNELDALLPGVVMGVGAGGVVGESGGAGGVVELLAGGGVVDSGDGGGVVSGELAGPVDGLVAGEDEGSSGCSVGENDGAESVGSGAVVSIGGAEKPAKGFE